LGVLTPGSYCHIDEGGYVLEPMYFFVEGDVVIGKNNDGSLSVEVNAVNSYDVPVHIVYNAAGVTSVENTNATNKDVRKQLINGQLLIQRDGKTYNVIGTVVK
jgi:hypothetical protein